MLHRTVREGWRAAIIRTTSIIYAGRLIIYWMHLHEFSSYAPGPLPHSHSVLLLNHSLLSIPRHRWHHHSLEFLLRGRGAHQGSGPGVVHVSLGIARRCPVTAHLRSVLLLMASHLSGGARSPMEGLALVVALWSAWSSAWRPMRSSLFLAVERRWWVLPGRPEHRPNLSRLGASQDGRSLVELRGGQAEGTGAGSKVGDRGTPVVLREVVVLAGGVAHVLVVAVMNG